MTSNYESPMTGELAGISLEMRVEGALAESAAGRLSPDARDVVEELLAQLEAGIVRAAQRDDSGTWQAVTWVKRGILLGFQLGTLEDMSPEPGPSGNVRSSSLMVSELFLADRRSGEVHTSRRELSACRRCT